MNRRTALMLLLVAGSVVTALLAHPYAALRDDLVDAAPWIVGGLAGGEVAWVAGAAVMLWSTGLSRRTALLRARQWAQAIRGVDRPRAFLCGFWLNTIGALFQVIAPAVAVCIYLPVETWGVLAPGLLDLAGTIALRRLLWPLRHPPAVTASPASTPSAQPVPHLAEPGKSTRRMSAAGQSE